MRLCRFLPLTILAFSTQGFLLSVALCQISQATQRSKGATTVAKGIRDVSSRIERNTVIADQLKETMQEQISKYGEIVYSVYGQEQDPVKVLMDLKEAYEAVYAASRKRRHGPGRGQL